MSSVHTVMVNDVQSLRTRRWPLVLLLVAFKALGAPWMTCAQNPCCIIVEPTDTNVTVLRSGGTLALQTRTRPAFFPSDPWNYSIAFSFGFATDEVAGEGEILDSATLFLENTNTGVSLVLFTADASGFVWLPFTPGLLLVGLDAIQFAPTNFADLQPLPAHRLSYQVTFAVPPPLTVGWTDVTLLLYDYPNGLNSVGYLGPVTVIPPPGKLESSPVDLFRTVGPTGGSFVPSSRIYSLTNAGGQTLAWRATPAGPWLAVNPASGQLAPGMTTNAAVSITSRARVFASGRYESEVAFENLSTGTNTELRAVELTIVDRPLLEPLPSLVPGEIRLQLHSTPLMTFRIEASQDLTAWTAIATNSTAANGTFEYAEPAPAYRRFYRASFVNP